MHRQIKRIFTVIILVAVVLSTLYVDSSVVKAAPKKKHPVLTNKSISLIKGKSKKLKVKHIPKKAKVNYSSKNRKIATVTKKGKITAKKVGKTVIKVTVRQGKRFKKILKCKVKVTPKNNSESKNTTSPLPSIVPTPLPYSSPTVSPNITTESPVMEAEGLGILSSDIAGAKTKVSESAVFTLDLAKNDISYKNMIYLYKDNQSVGCMHDDGKDGDAIADDDIYSLKVICYSAKETKEEYKAICNSSVSNTVELNYFEGLSEEDFKIQEDFVDSFQDLETKNTSVDGSIDTDKLLDEVYQKAIEGQTDGVVLSATKEDAGVVIQFASGIWYVYQPEIEGVDASGSDTDVSIMTLQPYQSTYDSNDQRQSTEATDDSAKRIAQRFDNYLFDKNYDDSNVTLDVIKNISSNQIVFCHTHGFYETDIGSMIWLGQKVSAAQLRSGGKYELDYLARRIVITNDYRVGFTAGYITKYCGDLTNSFLYLGACESGKDYRLAQSFINKGAKAVIANSETIWRGYNCSMMKDVANGLLQKASYSQNYYTLQEALSYAKDINGDNDYEWYPNSEHAPSTPLIYGDRNYRLSENIEVNSIKLNYTNVSTNVGNNLLLEAAVFPNNATNKTITWSSSNTSVATVIAGVVTGKSDGIAEITARSSNGKTAVCKVIVKDGVSTYKLFDSPMSWTEAKEYCENQGGHLVTITSQYENDIVMDLIKTGNKESYWTGGMLQEDKWKWCNGEYFSYSLWEAGEPNNYLDRGENCITIRPSTCTWYDSLMTGDPTGIEIESMGFVCEWETSSSVEPAQITLNKITETINEGDTFSLIATILPINVSNKTVSWSSSNTSVATVNNGIVTGKSTGTATIMATTQNGKSATCQVTVIDESVIKINNATELMAISNKLDGNYILAKDIDISDYNWKPIGTKNNPFKGTFDGARYKITGLTIKNIGEGYQGLFGYNKGILKNVNVSGSIAISGSLQTVYIGGICAYSEGGLIDSSVNLVNIDVDINNTNTGTVVYAGGIIGVADMYCIVSDCTNQATVEASAIGNGRTSSYAGGISGITASATPIKKCINNGNINAYAMMKNTKYFLTSYAGGITGDDSLGTVEECINNGSIKAEGYPAGKTEYNCVVGAGGIMGHIGSGIGTRNTNESSNIEAIGNEYVTVIRKGDIYGY